MNGKNIFGIAPMSGVHRAAFCDSAAIARWTTRKSVHQYPNDSTKPRPMTTPNNSTPRGFASGRPRLAHTCVNVVGSVDANPLQPPASRSPSQASGAKPQTIRPNCRTSL